MAEEVREQRAEGRDRRRSLAAKPFEELDEAAGNDTQPTPLDAARGVAATAAAAAIAGALAGAAKALLDRGSASSDGEAQGDEPPEPEAEHTVHQDKPSDEEHEAEPEDEEPQEAPPTAEAEAEPGEDPEPGQPRAAEEDADEPTAEHDDESDGARGNSPSDAIRIVQQAREHLRNLLGEHAESVSGVERENGNWSITLEVVELHRIPESTDILSSYSAVLDDEGGIVSLTRDRRYRRSQVEAS